MDNDIPTFDSDAHPNPKSQTLLTRGYVYPHSAINAPYINA